MASSISSHGALRRFTVIRASRVTHVLYSQGFPSRNPRGVIRRDRYRGIIEAEREAPTDILVASTTRLCQSS